MNCCEKEYDIGTCIMAISLSLLLLWNIGLTIAVSIIGNNDDNNPTSNTECFCVEQMTNIIEQISRLYPDSELFITLDGGDAIVGTPGEITLGPNGKSGIIEIITTPDDTTQLVSICSIDTITINNATYNEQITYLPEPDPLPTDCKADCDRTIRDMLPVGTQGANIITSTQVSTIGNVIVNEPSIIVIENTNINGITFILSCRIDVMFLPNES